MNIIAGFECGQLPWNNHDLLDTTRHTPGDRMYDHYHIAKEHGINMTRDGLNPEHGSLSRFITAKDNKVTVIWDLYHYHVPNRHTPVEWGGVVGRSWLAANERTQDDNSLLWVCPQNEPSVVPMMRKGTTIEQAVDEGKQVLEGLRSEVERANIRILHVDTPRQPDWFDATIIGVNIYPHLLTEPITDILKEAQDRTGKRVIISETSWHDGFHIWENIKSKGEWLDYVATQADLVGVEDICWYPFVDCKPWDEPSSQERWSHGLINKDLEVDASLSAAIKELTGGRAV